MSKPEELARQKIDAALQAAGWSVQDYQALNLSAIAQVDILRSDPSDRYKVILTNRSHARWRRRRRNWPSLSSRLRVDDGLTPPR